MGTDSEVFTFGDSEAEGNLSFREREGYAHDGRAANEYIPGHVVLMVGYDDRNVYVHDNSRPEVEMISWGDLQQVWAADYIGISKKNAYFGIDMQNPNRDISSIIQEGLKRNAELYLNSPVNFIGQKGMERMMKELPAWNTMYDAETMKQICLHLIEFSGSTLPEIPEELSGIHSGVPNTHQGGRDKLAAALLKYQDTIGTVLAFRDRSLFRR